MKHTGGNWDPKERPCYFIASDINSLQKGSAIHKHLLIAVNELRAGHDLDVIKAFAKSGHRVFVDSGVFNLTNEHARAHNVTMDVALGLAPDEIDGFDELFDKYCELIRFLGDDCWGYIEIDQGGVENKRITRARLEGMGFRPIPVYHPLNDGWDYFDELGQQYDRICLGNVVQADVPTRKRLIATAWHRRRKYPNLWIHALGLTPADWYSGMPMNSCDSSAWLSLVRWAGSYRVNIANKRAWGLGDALTYDLGVVDGPNGHTKAVLAGAYDAQMTMLTLRNICEDYETELGCDVGMYEAAV